MGMLSKNSFEVKPELGNQDNYIITELAEILQMGREHGVRTNSLPKSLKR
jgi:hypothetical protein